MPSPQVPAVYVLKRRSVSSVLRKMPVRRFHFRIFWKECLCAGSVSVYSGRSACAQVPFLYILGGMPGIGIVLEIKKGCKMNYRRKKIPCWNSAFKTLISAGFFRLEERETVTVKLLVVKQDG